jgi:demethoxyubiquinone hydroxylase (CLK1/Coq7/Cat5 family)
MSAQRLTLAELSHDVREIDNRVLSLEKWKASEDAYRAALAQIKNDEREAKNEAVAIDAAKRRTEITKQAGIVLGLIAAILYAYATTKGIATP